MDPLAWHFSYPKVARVASSNRSAARGECPGGGDFSEGAAFDVGDGAANFVGDGDGGIGGVVEDDDG